MYDVNGVCTENGVAPDVAVGITDEDFQKGEDTIIETARKKLQE
jgi:C-terminal processing protease CtpA/Prc